MKLTVRKDKFKEISNGQTVFTVTRSVMFSTKPESELQFHAKHERQLLPSVLRFEANGGTLTGVTEMAVFVGEKLNLGGVAFPTAVGPSDQPILEGWYTAASGGTKVTPETVFSGEYSVLYPHFSNASFTVNLNGEWCLSDESGRDPNGCDAPHQPNPDETQYDGVYQSFSNYNEESDCSLARMTITFKGYQTFTVFIRSYAESYYDYAMASELDEDIWSDGYDVLGEIKADTNGEQNGETNIESYKRVDYPNDGGEHTITIAFKKDYSVSEGNDRGYVLIKRS